MENFCNSYKSFHQRPFVILVLGVLCLALKCAALTLRGSTTSYARYPTWNGCPNASFSFEFLTTSTDTDPQLLWYVDDGGNVDFFVLTLESNRVKLVLRTVAETDSAVEIVGGNRVADGRWHRVEVRRRRMETLLSVDGAVNSNFTFGSDFDFGSGTNSDVYIGGLPRNCSHSIHSYSLPSVCLTVKHFNGKIRNVVYSNCTCQQERVSMLDGDGAMQGSEDRCQQSNPCPGDCLCISEGVGSTKCNCSNLQCTAVTHYELPMDEIKEQMIVNPSGLDAKAFGSPAFLRGIRNRSLELNGKETYIKVSGPSHRRECFGDLDRCPSGYTFGLWIQFAQAGDATAYTFLSNGGHSVENHGVAMLYSRRTLEARFKKKSGEQWIAVSSDVLPQRWYHVAASWHPGQGLFLYINGKLVHRVSSPTNGVSVDVSNTSFSDFIIGRPNDLTQANKIFQIVVDDFNFWSVFKSEEQIRETGPFFRYFSSMNSLEDVVTSNLKAQVRGRPGLVPGKIGKAMTFRTVDDYIEGVSLNESCLGNLTFCRHGITISMWIFFTDLQHDVYILSTGNQAINIYYHDGSLKGEVWEGRNHRVTLWSGAQMNRWYFLELSWLMGDWLRLYIDLTQVIEDESFKIEEPPRFSGSNFYVARGNGNLQNMGAFVVDDLELWYGDRETLISFDFIARGRPEMHSVTMDAIENSTLVHPYLQISLFGKPRITRGQIAGALNLDGLDKYLSLGPQEASCLGNLDLCRHGLLLSAWLKLGLLREGMDILSSGSNGLLVRYIASQVNVRARTSIHEWTVRTDTITDDVWIFLEIGWDPYKGLSLYVDNDLVSRSSNSTLRSDAIRVHHSAQQFYIGRGDGTESGASYGNLTIDGFEYWFGNREYLIAFGYLQRGRPQHYIVYMDLIRDQRIPHHNLNITVYGNPTVVSGKINNAISLNGSNQYVDLGLHEDVCLGYLEDCNNGLTGSIFLNFKSFRENMSCLTSGGGVRLFFSRQKLVVLLHEKRNQWRVEIPDLVTNKWYFFEYTWRRTDGLRVFVNNVMVGRQDSPSAVFSYPTVGQFLIGKGNTREGVFTFADVLVDEVQVWYGDRDQLVAFGYLLRDRVTYIVFPMSRARANTIIHPDYTVTMHSGARLVPGKVGNGVLLEGSGGFVSFEEQPQNCMRNLKYCKHGLTIAFLIKPHQLISDSYILCSGSYSIFFKDNKLFGRFSLPTKTWELSTDRISANRWTRLEVSWDEVRGLLFYVNGSLANSTFTYFTHSNRSRSDHMIYLGRPADGVVGGRYANATVDELEFWFANRDHLKAFDIISDEITRLIISMDTITGDFIDLPTNVIYVHGLPVTTNGIFGRAVLLNGLEQFINISGDVGCHGDLYSCPRGFTLRFKIKPNQLSENTYFVSSSILDVFYQNRRLVVDVHTTSKSWLASTENFQLGVWQQVEVSWHSVDGLTLYIDTHEEDQNTAGSRFEGRSKDVKFFYLGRFHSEMQPNIYASAVFDDFQFFESRREYLIPDLINPDRDLEAIRAAYPTTLPATVTPTMIRVLTVTPGFLPGANKWLVFDGNAWVRFSFSYLPDYYRWRNNSTQFIRMTFQTTSADGLLFLTGNSSCYFTLGLKDGKIKLVMNRTVSSTTGSRVYEDVFNPGQYLQLDDSAWHSIICTQHRDGLVKVVIDGQEFSKLFSSYVDLVNPEFLYFGGIGNTFQQTGSFLSENFNGTVSEAVIFDGTHENILNLILITVTEPVPAYVYQEGRVTLIDPVDTTNFCAAQPCRNGGLCTEGVNSFHCDCKLTSFIGHYCSAEAEGYEFGLEGAGGVVVFNMTQLETVVSEALAFGFMTWSDNGTLLSLCDSSSSSSSSSRFFEVRLVNGYVAIRYDFGRGIQEVLEIRRKFNDGHYHSFTFQRIGTNFSLQVDDLPVWLFSLQGSSSDIFRSLNFVELGARTGAEGIIFNPFFGIISGVYVNGYQITDLGVNEKDARVKVFGDTVIATHPFFVAQKRPDEVLPTKSVIIDGGGGGVGWDSDKNLGDEIVLIPGAEGGDQVADSQVGGAGYARAEEGGRAAAISGAMLALLAVVSSLMWATYRCKPGIVGRVTVDLDANTSATTSMLHSARKSISDIGAGDATVSQISTGYESWNFVSSDTSGRNLARASLSREMLPLATPGSHASTGLHVEYINQEINLGRNMETVGLGQERSEVTASQNVSTQMVLASSSAGNIGRTGVGHEMSQFTTSSRKVSTHMIVESESARSLGQSGLDQLQVMTSGRKVSTEMVVELNGDRNIGGTGLGQEMSQVSMGQNVSTPMVLGSSSAENIGRTGVGQEMLQFTKGQNVSTNLLLGTISAGNIGRTDLGQEMSQITTSSRKISTQMIVEADTGGSIGGTSLGQESSQIMISGQNASMQMVATSKVSKSQVPSVMVTVTGGGVPVTMGVKMEAKSAEHKEELIQLSEKERIDGKNLSPREAHGVKVINSLEKYSSSSQGQAFKTSDTQMRDHGSGFSAKPMSVVVPGSRDLTLSVSSDRSIPLMHGQPPKTLKLESPVREGIGQFSLVVSENLASAECRDLKVNASLDRSVSLICGQLPKTLKLQSPVQHGGSECPAYGSGDLQVPRTLERSSSSIQGQLPKTLRIESPVHPAGAGSEISIQKSGQATFISGSGISPTVWSTTGPPLSSCYQSSSNFTETKHLAGGTMQVESFASAQGIQLNSQLTSLSLTSKKYQIRNLPLNVSQEELYKHKIPTIGEPNWQLQSARAGLTEATEIGAGHHPPMSTETIRVECILLTADGQHLITGSVYGPPQVWDMKTGECLRIMEGDDLSSTDLHLANNDTLLIGQVADVERFNPNVVPGGLHYRRLQIWDVDSGRCLKMRHNELYTASFLMRDGEHVILSRTEMNTSASSSVVIVIWDILGNQPERRIAYSLENLPVDHITYVSQSTDKRFVVAGFKSPSSGNATYFTFDLTVSNFDVVSPMVKELAAEVEVTIVLENHEAVTGTKAGELVIWSLRTGRQRGQLMAPPAEVTGGRAHQTEVRDLVVSKDGQYLVSASADCTLKLWDLQVSKHVRTFVGHSDEVSCCAISNDSELIVSGSRDQTIRLWRLDDGILVTSILTSADIFRVLLSNDKKTIVALADRVGARKLVMLQVVRTKTKQRIGSSGESSVSPNSPFSPP